MAGPEAPESRPHPLYYGFLHREIFAMLTPAQLDAYLGPLESRQVRPALITLDTELRFLGARFAKYLQANYVSNDGEFYWPVARPRPNARDGGLHAGVPRSGASP